MKGRQWECDSLHVIASVAVMRAFSNAMISLREGEWTTGKFVELY